MTQCKATSSRGPCLKTAGPTGYCVKHVNDQALASAYRLTDPALQEAVKFHATGNLLDIRQQLVLMNSIIERRLNLAGDTNAEQVSAFNFVATQLQAVSKMTETLVKLGRESGELMNRVDVDARNEELLGIVVDVAKEHMNEKVYAEFVDELSKRVDEIESDE
jgi:hypothetical protein